jgi:DNA-directed RNA polymerase III subunit RPC6
MPPKKRAASAISTTASKRIRSSNPAGNARRIKAEPGTSSPLYRSSSGSASGGSKGTKGKSGGTVPLRDEFISLFAKPQYAEGLTNSQLKAVFQERYKSLAPIFNALYKEGRLTISEDDSGQNVYKLVSEELAVKFAGLGKEERMVYQIIEVSGDQGKWIKNIKIESGIVKQTLDKIIETLEKRKLIKPVKAVKSAKKKLYMLYDLQPAKDVTGGPWYTDLEFDHQFISELRTFIMVCVKNFNAGKGVTLKEIVDKMRKVKVSRVELGLKDVQQLLQTLAFDYMIEQSGVNQNGEALFIESKKATPVCDFKWWEVICPDFHFRTIRFEDDVVLNAHEPHYHTA